MNKIKNNQFLRIKMKTIKQIILKELVFKLDFEKGEFEIGWIWVIYIFFDVFSWLFHLFVIYLIKL